jgi:hypothetical protein
VSATSVTVTIAAVDRTGEVQHGSITIRDVLDEGPNTCDFTVIGTTQEGAFDVSAFEESAFTCDVAVTADSGTFEVSAFEADAFDTTQGAFVAIAPVIDADVRITLGDGTVLFGGQIDTVEEFYEGGRRINRAWHVNCTDYTHLANRRKVRIRYLTQSASDIASDVITRFTTGFTRNAIQPGLPAIAIEFTDETVVGALTRIADRIGGYCYIDYDKDVHLFITESTATPDPITEAAAGSSTARALRAILDARQRRTRVYVEGGGSTAQNAVPAGSTSIPVIDATWYNGSGGIVVSGPQRIPYGGKGIAGGPTALTATAVTTPGNLGRGPYSYKYAFVTSGTEGPLSPVSNIPSPESMTVAAPSTAITVGAAGQSVPAPTTPVTATPTGFVTGPIGVITVQQGIADTPPVGEPPSGRPIGGTTGGNLTPDRSYFYHFGYGTAQGETAFIPGSWSAVALSVTENAATILDVPISGDGRVTRREIYRSIGYGPSYSPISATEYNRLATIANNTTNQYLDTAATASGPNPPTVNTTSIPGPGSLVSGAAYKWKVTYVASPGETTGGTEQNLTLAADVHSAALSNLPISPDPRVTARKIYRTKANGSTYFLEQTIANNTTTTATSTIADSALGAALPTTNTTGTGSLTPYTVYRYRVTFVTATGETTGGPEQAINLDAARTVALSAIPTSGDGRVTARRVYRTLANGSAFFLDTAIADNTTTTLSSSKADGSLGAAMPTTNTTGSGGLTTGALYRYKVTYITAQGETSGSPEASVSLTGDASTAALSTIPVSADARVTARKIYRTQANGSEFLFEQTITNNTATTATSASADTTLGAPLPITNTAVGGGQMSLTGIATGSAGVTARNVYRTIAGGAAYKLLVALGDNTTTTYTDNKADSSLGATSPDEEISELTGIPAGAILYDIKAGDAVNIEVQVDDLTAQAESGIIEHKIVDGRLSISEAQARGQADLLLHAPTLQSFSYQTRDTKTRSGKTIQVSLAIPALTASLKIQDVTITEIDIAKNLPPLYTVQSSSVLFSYEDMLRRTRLFPT